MLVLPVPNLQNATNSDKGDDSEKEDRSAHLEQSGCVDIILDPISFEKLAFTFIFAVHDADVHERPSSDKVVGNVLCATSQT